MMPRSPLKPRSKARLVAHRDGHRGEMLAAWWLRLQFYRIVAQRYKTPGGEIDLIARRFGVTVFVEVKLRRKTVSLAEAFEAVNHRRIVQAADYWIGRNPAFADTDMRFDVIFLAPWTWPRHVINAFDAGP